ncbi:MFS transporter [Paenibacillus sp. NPDC058071]|uniref:MFS transporter n=1 Tax=Paenibacillus sp. NPDC058071 TaxID=3346326 RepID=UPI0036DCD605
MHKRSLYNLLATQTMANAADILYTMALTLLVLQNTSSVLAAAFVPFIRSGSQIISSLLAPLLIARFQLPFLLFISQTGQFLLFAALAAYLFFAGDHAQLSFIILLVFAMSFLDGWTTPSRNALIPRLVNPDGLLKANSMFTISDRVVQFAGWGLSGVLLALVGTNVTLLITALLYAAAFILTAAIYDPLEKKGNFLLHPRTVNGSGGGDSTSGSALSVMKEGFQTIRKSPRLRTLTFMDIIDMLGVSVWYGAFTLVFVQTVLKRGEEWWGFINASYFGGSLLGGMVILALATRLQRRSFVYMLSGMTVYALITVAYALTSWPPAALILIALTGPAAELAAITRQTLVQQSATPEQLPNVLSAQNSFLHAASMASLLILGWAADHFGIVSTYMTAVVLTLIAVLVGIASRHHFRSHKEQQNSQ